ncbi:MAG TPA: hypothetical protein PLG97_03200 [Alcaligenes sp.]|nr:hypothetical protein [Alcaligenes sp.]HRL26504.1 hypothetical protein [Alcaligenes sp.]
MMDFLKEENQTEIAIIVVFALATFWILGRAMHAVKSGTNPKLVEIAPTMMTSCGILGTFFGIVLGLFAFDPANIDDSIRGLLGGLRTAFVTSLVGMFCAMLFKWWESKQVKPESKQDDIPDDVGPREIYAVMNNQQILLSTLVSSIGGKEEGSLVGQLKLLRTELSDFKSSQNNQHRNFEEKLWTQLQTFGDLLSKSATEQVIEALSRVITEFNQNLTEQFGDNFKRLDESVKKLVDWQVEYKGQMEKMTELFDLGVKSIDGTRVAVEAIKVETGRIPQDMQALSGVLSVNQHQIQELARHLDAFIEMRAQATQAMPEIQRKLEEVGSKIREGADAMTKIILEGAAEFGDSVMGTNQSLIKTAHEIAGMSEAISQELTSSMIKVEQNTDLISNGISQAVQTAMGHIEANVSQSADALNQSMEQTVNTMRQTVERGLNGLERQITDVVSQTEKAVNAQIQGVDKALETQLNAALDQLGSALATIAKHLLDTYSRQTRELDAHAGQN